MSHATAYTDGIRALLLAVAVTGCGSSAPAGTASEPAACVLYEEPGMSNPSPDVECVPPRQLDARESAERWSMEGDFLRAGDCFVAAYEAAPSEPSLALEAVRAYERAGRADLARSYARRAE